MAIKMDYDSKGKLLTEKVELVPEGTGLHFLDFSVV